MNKAHLTAIHRKGPSVPLKHLLDNNLIQGPNVLDFGCGHGADVAHLRTKDYNAVGYDPHWNHAGHLLTKSTYNTVLCTYVLNVVDKRQRDLIIKTLKNLTKPGGSVYITVRRDLKEDYVSSKGTHQYLVKLPYNVVKETRDYCIYEMINE